MTLIKLIETSLPSWNEGPLTFPVALGAKHSSRRTRQSPGGHLHVEVHGKTLSDLNGTHGAASKDLHSPSQSRVCPNWQPLLGSLFQILQSQELAWDRHNLSFLLNELKTFVFWVPGPHRP